MAQSDISYTGEGHLITIAPTGSGKGRSVIIPNLLNYAGPIVVIDPKGENYAVTKEFRERLGQKVIKLDPFDVCSGFKNFPDLLNKPDSFNPFDIISFSRSDLTDDTRTLTKLIYSQESLNEPFWDLMAQSLISAIVLHLAHKRGFKKGQADFSVYEVKEFLSFWPVETMAEIADDDSTHPDVKLAFASFLSFSGADKTRDSILATAQSYLTVFGDSSVREATSKTSFDLDVVYSSLPFTLYIIIPANKLVSHKSLLRFWVGSLLRLMTSRSEIPDSRTLLLVDEAAQLGHLELLQEAITLSRGYGIQVWTFWQDINQIRSAYGDSWLTIFNNCGISQFFGPNNYASRCDIADILGVPVQEMESFSRHDILISILGDQLIKSSLIDYLNDNTYIEKSSQNPYYRSKSRDS